MQDVDPGRGCAWEGARGGRNCICIFYSVLLEPKTILKIKSTFYKFKQNWGNAKKPKNSGVRYHPGNL